MGNIMNVKHGSLLYPRMLPVKILLTLMYLLRDALGGLDEHAHFGTTRLRKIV